MAVVDSGLQVVPEPSGQFGWQLPEHLVGQHDPSKQYFPGAGVDLSADESPRSRFCGGRRRLFVVGLLVACVIGVVVGGAVGGTKQRRNGPKATSLPVYVCSRFRPSVLRRS